MPKNTDPNIWCEVEAASSAANSLFVLGQIPGFVVTGLTLLYALTVIKSVEELFAKAKSKGVTDKIFKFILAGCWGALWGFLAFYVVCIAITWIFYSRKNAPVPC